MNLPMMSELLLCKIKWVPYEESGNSHVRAAACTVMRALNISPSEEQLDNIVKGAKEVLGLLKEGKDPYLT